MHGFFQSLWRMLSGSNLPGIIGGIVILLVGWAVAAWIGRRIAKCMQLCGHEDETCSCGRAGVIIGRDSYGQGSSREHAAICPMYLGVKAVAALAIERIHRANLINFGILPLIFSNPADYDRIGEKDALILPGIREQLAVGKPVKGIVRKADGSEFEIEFNHPLSARDIELVLAGGRLNCK